MKPIKGITVMFRKGTDGQWHSYTAYGCDLEQKLCIQFMDCIAKAADVLNKKGGDDE